MKLLTLAIVGRANVGKSTLFNVLTQSRQALVVDRPGVTRDRLYGQGIIGGIPYQLVDTCGVEGEQTQSLSDEMHQQLHNAILEADAVLFVVDARVGLLPQDRAIADSLRTNGKSVYIIVNKTDGLDQMSASGEFFELGFDTVIPIAAAHKRGISKMIELIASDHGFETTQERPDPIEPKGLKIAVLGRPNVGKSTLINRMLQEERVVTFDMPGTTRDSIYIPLERHGKFYTLIDTAGVRKKARVYDVVEKFSVIKTKQAIHDADCVMVVVNAQEDVFDQDLTLLRQAMKVGRAMVVVVNKWDGLSVEERKAFKEKLKEKTRFAPAVRIHTISALHGTGVGDLFELAESAYEAASQDISTSKLTRILEGLVQSHQPPYSKGRRIALKYAHCVGHNPLKILIHGNQTDAIPESYKKYIHNGFSKALNLVGGLLHIEYRSSDNPYKGKRNILTKRQQHKKKRMMKFVKKTKK